MLSHTFLNVWLSSGIWYLSRDAILFLQRSAQLFHLHYFYKAVRNYFTAANDSISPI